MKIKRNKNNKIKDMDLDRFLKTMDYSDLSSDENVHKDLKNNEMYGSKKIKEKIASEKIKNKNMKFKQKDKKIMGKTNEQRNEIIDDIKSHKQSIEKLKQIDPEFYKFLENNDKQLLHFDALVEENAEEVKESDNDVYLHKPNENLEVASDESDFELLENEGDSQSNIITLKLLKQWQEKLISNKIDAEIIKIITQAFNSALISISPDAKKTTQYKVKGSATFNGVVQLCILYLRPAIWKFLGIDIKKYKDIHKYKKWNKIRNSMRSYVTDLTSLLENVSSANILIVLLKHFHQMLPVIITVSGAVKPVLKRLVTLWSTSEETVRVLAFICILKLTRSLQQPTLILILKAMYMSYVKYSKFVSPLSLPGINFMRRSLTEMFALDLNVAYQHIFLYIRQLAIHLRNALILKKRESYQTVYNWQFINSLRLWTDVLASTYNKPQLQPLIYPLVTIIQGVIKLIPTAQWIPLRFHCIQILISLSKKTKVFIPTLPFILEILNSSTFNRKPKQISMKGMSFDCILRVTKPQLGEVAFRTEVVEHVFAFILEYLARESYSISFPDMVVPCVIILKNYVKKSKNANAVRKLKQLIGLIQENSKMIEDERKKINFSLKDQQLITSWETQLYNKRTPLLTFYNNWSKLHDNKRKREAGNIHNINEYNLPTLKKRQNLDHYKKSSSNELVELFPSDSENDELDVEKPLPKRQKKICKEIVRMKNISGTIENDFINSDTVDIVKDLDLNDWMDNA